MWLAFVQSEAEGWGWQLIRKEEPRLILLDQGEAAHSLYKSSRGSHDVMNTNTYFKDNSSMPRHS